MFFFSMFDGDCSRELSNESSFRHKSEQYSRFFLQMLVGVGEVSVGIFICFLFELGKVAKLKFLFTAGLVAMTRPVL